MEMETFGRVDKYNVVKSIRVSNVTVQGMDSKWIGTWY
jgi:hypothetical protein